MIKIFGKRLHELRIQNSETQQDLAEQFKVSRGMISHWEQGRYYPEVSTLIEIAEYFNVTTDYLLGLEDESGTKYINSFNNFNNNGNINIK